MSDLETALKLLQNKLRRQILERLVREPHYPCNSLTCGVSQQAIKKHLKELERGNFVMKMEVPSEKEGLLAPFTVQQSMSLRIDLGPTCFL